MNIKQINSRELVLKTIQHQYTTRVPKGELVLDDEVIRQFLKIESINFNERLEFINHFGLDLVTLSPKYSKTDVFSIDISNINAEKWAKDTSLFTFVILDGAFEYGLRAIGFQDFFTMIMTEEEETLEFISKVERLNIETIMKLADCGIDGIIIADDIAFQDGLMMRPNHFRELFLPSLEKQVKAIEQKNMIPFFHSDGNYLAVIEDIIDAGFKGIHCMDKQCNVTLHDLQPFSDKLCIWGHLDTDDIHSSSDPVNMNKIVQDIKNATNFKGFILGTNSGLFTGMDVNRLSNIYKSVDMEKKSAL